MGETGLDRQENFSQFQLTTDALRCHIHLPVCFVNQRPSQQGCKEEYDPWNEMLPQGTTHLRQRPCYQWRSPCPDPAGNRATRRPSDYRKEPQTEVVWTCIPFIRSGQNCLARHSERREKTRQTEKKWEDNVKEWDFWEVFNRRPAQPRYIVTWDGNVVLNFPQIWALLNVCLIGKWL